MLDLKFVCENIEEVKQRLSHRSGKFDLEGLGALAEERRSLIQDGENKKATKNAVSKLIPMTQQSIQMLTDRSGVPWWGLFPFWHGQHSFLSLLVLLETFSLAIQPKRSISASPFF